MGSWGKEEDDRLKRLVSEGASAKDIAGFLGRTRNAILGRAWRLGLSLSGEAKPRGRPRMVSVGRAPAVKCAKRKLAPRKPKVPQAPRAVNVEAFAKPPTGGVVFLDLHAGCCKWPTGDLFCGEATGSARLPYCPQHARTGVLATFAEPAKRGALK